MCAHLHAVHAPSALVAIAMEREVSTGMGQRHKNDRSGRPMPTAGKAHHSLPFHTYYLLTPYWASQDAGPMRWQYPSPTWTLESTP